MASESTLNHALVALFEHIASTDEPVLIDYYTAQEWPVGALDKFLRLGLITLASSAQSLECKACENHCFMDVLTLTDNSTTRAFIVCEDPVMQSQMGRMEIPIEHLKQWQSSSKHLAKVISHLLNLDDSSQKTIESKIRLGMLKSSKGRRWVSLQNEPLSLEINQYLIPINELLNFEDEELQIDRFRIDELLERAPQSKNMKYQPSTDKRELGKLKTQEMHQDWKDEYIKLKKNKPNMSDVWYSKQIAKMDISQDKKSETIRNYQKKHE